MLAPCSRFSPPLTMITIEPPSSTSLSADNSCARTPRGFVALRRALFESGLRASTFACRGGGGRAPFGDCKRVLLVGLSMLVATALHAQSSQGQLTWSDEFNAANGSPPDSVKWNTVTGGEGFGNNEQEIYTSRPANVQQQNGKLVITARKEDLTGPDGIPRHYSS